MVKEKETLEKASKGYIEDYYNTNNSISKDNKQFFGSLPKFDRRKAIEAIRGDSTVMGALNTLVDKALKNGHEFIAEDGKSNLDSLKKMLDKVRFNRVLRQLFYNLFAYGNAFVEIVRTNSGTVKELHVLETTFTEPLVDIHGEVYGYQQIVLGKTENEYPFWEKDEIVHFTLAKITTGIWAELDIESVYTSVLIKQYIYAYLGWLFGTNQFKGFYSIEEANSEAVEEFISYLKSSQRDIEKPIIARGKVEHQILRDFKDGETIIDLLNKCDANILTNFQVPPISIGLPGDSNRSNSDAQERSLNTRIISVHRNVEDTINFDLFRLMGYPKVDIKFLPVEDINIEKLLQDVERMKNIGFKKSVVEEYLKLNNFPIDGSLIDKKTYELETTKSEDMFSSRQRKPEGDSNEKIGTGKEGTTREDQLVSKGNTKGETFFFD